MHSPKSNRPSWGRATKLRNWHQRNGAPNKEEPIFARGAGPRYRGPVPTITFLFVDQVESTRFLTERGERASTDRDALFRIIRFAVAAHHGEVVDQNG